MGRRGGGGETKRVMKSVEGRLANRNNSDGGRSVLRE